MISYKQAFSFIKKELDSLEVEKETILLEDSINRTIAENIIADINLPFFDNSAVDGIAVKYNSKIKEWEISDEISAGNYRSKVTGEAVLIMTGAKVPPQFDTVIPLEDYTLKNNKAYLNDSAIVKKGINIRKRSSDIMQGEIVVKKNTNLTARNIAAIASCGRDIVMVYQKLKLGVLATGDELVPITVKPTEDKIRTSNNYGLTSAIHSLYQVGINYGFINDDYDATKNKIAEMLNSNLDIIITTGGVSVGKYDFVKDVFSKLGVKELFWKVYIKPGKPLYFGKFDNNGKTKLVFGLPGNPVSCMVNFDVFIKPNIQSKFGITSLPKIKAQLLNDIRKKDKKRHFVKGNIKINNGEYYVASHVSQSSGNLVGFSLANCLIDIKEKTINPKQGDFVECILI